MNGRRGKSDDDDGGPVGSAVLVIGMLWLLRWFILAAVAVTVVVLVIRWVLRRRAQQRAAERARLAAIRQRADIQNDQVLRGDPAGFFGRGRLPDPELIPTWYKTAG